MTRWLVTAGGILVAVSLWRAHREAQLVLRAGQSFQRVVNVRLTSPPAGPPAAPPAEAPFDLRAYLAALLYAAGVRVRR